MYKEDLALNNLQWLMRHKNPTQPNPIYLICMYKEDLALNNLQWLICYKTQPNQIKPEQEPQHRIHFFGGMRWYLFFWNGVVSFPSVGDTVELFSLLYAR